MRLFVHSSALVGILAASFRDAQVSAAAINSGDYLVVKAYVSNQCTGTADIIYLSPITGFTFQDCVNAVGAGACAQSASDARVYVKKSCTRDLPTLMRTEYPKMDVIQEQEYKDAACSQLDGIYISPALATDKTVTTCTSGSTFYRLSTMAMTSAPPTPTTTPTTSSPTTSAPAVTFMIPASRATARPTLRIVGLVCGSVTSVVVGYLLRKCCCVQKKEAVDQQTPSKPQSVLPIE